MKFINEEHKQTFWEYLGKDETLIKDVERQALFYVLSGAPDVRSKGISNFYDFEDHVICPEAFEKVDLSTSSRHLLELAFNLYNNFITEEQPTLLDTFDYLDKDNFELAIEGIRLRCS